LELLQIDFLQVKFPSWIIPCVRLAFVFTFVSLKSANYYSPGRMSIKPACLYCVWCRCRAFNLCWRQSDLHTNASGAIYTGEGELYSVWCSQLTKVSANYFRGKEQWWR